MRSRLGLLLSLAPALAGTACIPARDNPHDPNNRPEASLAVYVGTDGSANVGGRSDLFTLDASGSVDRKGRAMRFDWSIDGQPGFEVSAGDLPQCAVGPPPCIADCGTAEGDDCLRTRLAIPPDVLPGGVGAFNLTVAVRVHAGGTSDIAEADASVTNRAPVVDLGADVFTPDLIRRTVLLDACAGRTSSCASFDPDGDALEWEWTPLRGDFEGFLPASNDTRLLFVAPADEQTMLFEATASDGVARSTARVRVHVGSQAWLTTFDPTLVWRIFADTRPLYVYEPGPGNPPETYLPEGGITSASDGSVWIGVSFLDTAGLLAAGSVQHMLPGNDGLSPDSGTSWTHPGAFVPTSLATAGGDVCAVFRTHTDDIGTSFTPPSFFAWLEPGIPVGEGADSDELGEEPKFVHPLGAAECWAVTGALPSSPAGASVYRVQPGGSVTAVDIGALDDVTASVDSSGTLWIAGPGRGCVSAVLRYAPDDPSGTPVGCHTNRVDAMAPHPDGGLWLHDAETLEIWHLTESGEVDLTDAPPIGVPQDQFFPRGEPVMVSDPLSRDLWIVDDNLRRVGRLGDAGGSFAEQRFMESQDIRLASGIGRFKTLAFLPESGRVVAPMIEEGFGGALLNVPSHMKVIERITISSPFVVISPEPTRGDIWVADSGATGALRRMNPAGSVQTSVALGDVLGVAATSDGGAWAGLAVGNAGRLSRVDRDGTLLEQHDAALPITTVSVREEADALCAIADDMTDDVDGIELVRLDLIGGQLSAVSPGELFPNSVRAVDGGCWYAFENAVLFFDGSTVQPVTQATDPFLTAFSLDVDFDGTAWFAGDDGGGVFAFSATPGSGATRRLPAYPFDLNALDVQRRCTPGACSVSDPLRVWVSSNTSVHRLDESGNILQAYEIPTIGNITALDVLP